MCVAKRMFSAYRKGKGVMERDLRCALRRVSTKKRVDCLAENSDYECRSDHGTPFATKRLQRTYRT